MTITSSKPDSRRFCDVSRRGDTTGVGHLMQICVDDARSVNPMIKLGNGGEHGGVKFCNTLGLNYVSCSPKRVPVARLAAAQAALESK